jgi:dihydroxyacetone kinase-like protein
MTTIDTARIVAMFTRIAEAIESEKDRLCALDGVIGDADHGIAMSEGFLAVRTALDALDASTADPTAAFNTAAKSFLNAVGASSGPLYATAFMRAGAAVKGKETLTQADFVAAFQAMAKGIQDRGKAEPGEKTMVDAWAPAAEAAGAAQAAGKALPEVLEAAADAAASGMEATKQMIAGKGRSSRLGERAVGHVDPGAASATVMIAAIRDALR